MGRTYYQVPTQHEDKRLVHILVTDAGVVILAMRPPKVNERGYCVGVDFTVRNAVKEMLAEWTIENDGPGWLHTAELERAQWSQPKPGDEVITVTILAAFMPDARRRRDLHSADECAACAQAMERCRCDTPNCGSGCVAVCTDCAEANRNVGPCDRCGAVVVRGAPCPDGQALCGDCLGSVC